MVPLAFVSSSHLSTMSNAATLQKRRGIIHTSITRLTNRFKDLENNTDKPVTFELAQGITRKHWIRSSGHITTPSLTSMMMKRPFRRSNIYWTTTTTLSLISLRASSSSSMPARLRPTRPLVRSHLDDSHTWRRPCPLLEQPSRPLGKNLLTSPSYVSTRKNLVTARRNSATCVPVSCLSTWRKRMSSPRYKLAWREKSLIHHFKSRSYCSCHHTSLTLPPHPLTEREWNYLNFMCQLSTAIFSTGDPSGSNSARLCTRLS